eukprot:s267_g36.t1
MLWESASDAAPSDRDNLDDDDTISLLAHQGPARFAEEAVIDNPDIAIDEHDAFLHQDAADDPLEDPMSDANPADEDISDTASTFDSEERSHFFHIFPLSAPLHAARIRTDSWAVMLGNSHASSTQCALVQHRDDILPGQDDRMILIDIVFHGHNVDETNTHRYARLLPHQITRESILHRLGVQPYCALPRIRKRCLVRLNGHRLRLQDALPHHLEHADYLRIDLPPLPRSDIPTRFLAKALRNGAGLQSATRQFRKGVDSDFEWESVSITDCADDSLHLLQRQVTVERQTSGPVAHTRRPTDPDRQVILLDQYIPPNAHVQVDFAETVWAQQLLQACPLYMADDLPAGLDLPEVTQHQLANLISPPEDLPPLGLHFYVDGSKLPDRQVGAAVLLLCEFPQGLAYGGHLCRKVNDAHHAHLGEHSAMILALLWAHKWSDWFRSQHSQALPSFHFHFDATGTGYQAAGWWRTVDYHRWKIFMRAIVHILEHRHGISALHWQHVKAHNQHPWNEFVDQLAKHASRAGDLVADCQPWISWIHDDSLLVAIQWIWFLEQAAAMPFDLPPFTGHVLDHQVLPPTSFRANSTNAPDNVPKYQTYQIDVQCATFNVLTLAGLSRQRLLQQQAHDAGCHIVALQETRHRHLQDKGNALYHIIGHAATPQGHDGVQLWVTKQRPLYRDGPLVKLRHLYIVDSSPTHLILKLQMPEWRCLLVTGRAPHSGHDGHVLADFWRHVSAIRSYERDMPVIFLGDTNAHLGSHLSEAVGDLDASVENAAGQYFHDWVLEHRLFAPSSFHEFHHGDVHRTFVSPDGEHQTRIDYVAVPQDISFQFLETWVDDAIDAILQRPDHFPLVCHLRYEHSSAQHRRVPSAAFKLNTLEFVTKMREDVHFQALRQQLTNPTWALDSHQSADVLAHQTQRIVKQIAPSKMIWKRKQHLSSETWDLVEKKKHAFRQLKTLRRTKDFTVLHALFLGWRTQTGTESSSCRSSLQPLLATLPAWLRLHDQSWATTFKTYRLLSGQVLHAVRAEDAAYYAGLADETAHSFTREGLTGIWRKLKGVLPKHRNKRCQVRYDMGDGLLHHFEQLEAGQTMPTPQLYETCLQQNCEDLKIQDGLTFVALAELPTLVEIEDLCLRQKPHRAPGPDCLPSDVCRAGAASLSPCLHNLVLKSFLNGMEPLRFKGGHLVSIWKGKGAKNSPEAHRGILLADMFAKAVRLHCRLGRLRRILTGTLFIDLKAAFHHMIRELIFSVRHDWTQQHLSRILDPQDFDIPQLLADIDTACRAAPVDIPAGLRRLLHDIHHNTWFRLDSTSSTATRTKLIGFNLFISRIIGTLETALADMPQYLEGQRALGVCTPPIAWVDDLAIPIALPRLRQHSSLISCSR